MRTWAAARAPRGQAVPTRADDKLPSQHVLCIASSAGSQELLVSLLEALGVGACRPVVRYRELDAVHRLDAVLEHRPVDLNQDVPAHLDDEVRPHADDVPV